MTIFDAVEILAEFSKSIRHALIVLEGLNDLDDVDRGKVSALADAVRHVHADAADYLASVIGAVSKNKKAAVSE